jgi:vanadium chloroperoxidase
MPESLLFWSEVAFDAHRVALTGGEQAGGKLAARALGAVHLAMYDAYIAVARPAEFAPYLQGLPAAPSSASASAAVAGAAHETLSALFPSQRPFFDARLAEANVHDDLGLSFGREIAAMLLAYREGARAAVVAVAARGELGAPPWRLTSALRRDLLDAQREASEDVRIGQLLSA